MKEIKWGIIGCGDVVENKSGPSILRCSRSRITAGMRRNSEKLAAFSKRFHVPMLTSNANELINSPEVNLVYIATPPNSHWAYVKAAAKANKHILVEKPMGLNEADSIKMVDACNRVGVELFVAYYRRFHLHVLKMRELIHDGAIGKVVHAQVEFASPHCPGRDWGWRTDPAISGGGLFVDVLSHRIDLMSYFLGVPSSISATKRSIHDDSNKDDVATILVQFEQDTQCTIIGNFASKKSIDRLVLMGTEGEIRTEYLDEHSFTLERNGATESFVFERTRATHAGLVNHIESVLLDGAKNQCSGQDGLVIDKILDTFRNA